MTNTMKNTPPGRVKIISHESMIRGSVIDVRKQIALKARALSLNKKYNNLKF